MAPGFGLAGAGESSDDWEYVARIYGWFPGIDGDLKYSLPGGQDSASVDAGDVLDALQMTFMGGFMARKGDWSFLTDLIYLKLANDKDNAIRTPGGFGPGVTVNVDQEVKGWVWNLAGAYTMYRTPQANLDVLLGLRMFSVDADAKLSARGSLPPTLPGRSLSKSETLWDGMSIGNINTLFPRSPKYRSVVWRVSIGRSAAVKAAFEGIST